MYIGVVPTWSAFPQSPLPDHTPYLREARSLVALAR